MYASVQIHAWGREDRRKERTNNSFAPGAMINRLPRWFSGKESTCQCRRRRFSPWVGNIPWRRKWHPTPEFLPEKSHGQRSLGCYNPRGDKELDTTSSLNNNNYDKHFLQFHFILQKNGTIFIIFLGTTGLSGTYTDHRIPYYYFLWNRIFLYSFANYSI